MLSQQEIGFYREHGYLIVEDVFSAAEIAELRRVTDEFVEKSRDLAADNAAYDLEPDHTPENPRVKTIKNTAKLHPVYRGAIENPKLLDKVAQLIGPAFRYNSDKLNLKLRQPGAPASDPPLKWTQPWAYFPHTNDDIVIAGVAIDDATVANGCLLVVPGTHRGRIYDHHLDGKFTGKITEAGFRPEGAVPLEVRAGGVTLRHVRLMRSNGPNHSAPSRRIVTYHYCAADAWPLLAGERFFETYVATFLRGQPTHQPRLADIPVRLPVTYRTACKD